MAVLRINMNNKCRILFCRRNPADAGWLYKLTPKATFLKEFNSLEEAAKFIANNVYIPRVNGIGRINQNSRIVLWRFRRMKPNEISIIENKLVAMCRKGLIYNA